MMKMQFQKRRSLIFLEFLLIVLSLNLRSVRCFPLWTNNPRVITVTKLVSLSGQWSARNLSSRIRSQAKIGVSRPRRRQTLLRLYSTDPSNNFQDGENIMKDSSDETDANVEERDLYAILNASPTDSTQTLKRNYRTLARQTHPDALIGSANDSEYQREQAAIQFAEITAAYKTLSDPKTRLQYDRSLKAKEFTDNVLDSVEGGMRTVFKTAYQTAGTIRSVGEQIDKAREETSYRLELASKISKYRAQSQALKQRSVREENWQVELLRRLDDPKRKKRNPWLEQTSNSNGSNSYGKPKGTSSFFPQSSLAPQSQEFTSNAANEVAKTLLKRYEASNNNGNNFGDPATNGSKDESVEETLFQTIERLVQVESDLKNVTKAHEESQKEMARARTQLDSIQQQEERALKAVEAAQAAYEAAKQATKEQERAYGDLLKQERVSYSKVEKSESSLRRQQDRTKETLRRTEDLYIWKENTYLRDEARQAKKLSQKLLEKSEEFQKKADALKQELDSI